MYEKAVSFGTMDYQLVFWGYTFAIKKLTWFAQVIVDAEASLGPQARKEKAAVTLNCQHTGNAEK